MGMEELMSKLKVETAEEGEQWSMDRNWVKQADKKRFLNGNE